VPKIRPRHIPSTPVANFGRTTTEDKPLGLSDRGRSDNCGCIPMHPSGRRGYVRWHFGPRTLKIASNRTMDSAPPRLPKTKDQAPPFGIAQQRSRPSWPRQSPPSAPTSLHAKGNDGAWQARRHVPQERDAQVPTDKPAAPPCTGTVGPNELLRPGTPWDCQRRKPLHEPKPLSLHHVPSTSPPRHANVPS